MDDEIIPSALNYTGGKQKLLPQLKPLFPDTYSRFIDLFAGGKCNN
ncbi:DNA adenine methylase [Enterococcus faecium]|nr:DNA adenine methylase [Enterococcus faecium]